MAIQIRARNVDLMPYLVLDVNVEFYDDGERMGTFLAETVETNPQDVECPECSIRIGYSPIFRSTGTGWQNFSATLACLDLLLGKSYKTSIRRKLESRLLELQARGCASYSIRFKIHYEGSGQPPDHVVPDAWYENRCRYFHEQTSSCLVPERENEEINHA